MFRATVALVDKDDQPYCGSVWLTDKNILTANHCIKGESLPIHLRGFNGATFDADVVHIDPDRDLALLTVVEPPEGHYVTTLAHTWVSGEELHIFGFPAREEWVYKHGYLQRLKSMKGANHTPAQLFMVQAPVWFGNSGGPAFDNQGHLVGICSMLTIGQPNQGLFVPLPEIKTFLSEP